MVVDHEVKSAIHRLVSDWGMTEVLRAMEEVAHADLDRIKSDGEDGREYAIAYEQFLNKIEDARRTAEFMI